MPHVPPLCYGTSDRCASRQVHAGTSEGTHDATFDVARAGGATARARGVAPGGGAGSTEAAPLFGDARVREQPDAPRFERIEAKAIAASEGLASDYEALMSNGAAESPGAKARRGAAALEAVRARAVADATAAAAEEAG